MAEPLTYEELDILIDHDPIVVRDRTWAEIQHQRAEIERLDRERAYYADQLMAITTGLQPLCACGVGSPSPERQEECPIHGDGTTFVAEVKALRDVVRAARRWHGTDNPGTRQLLCAAIEQYERGA